MKNGKKIACLTLTAAMALSCMGAGTALMFADTGSPVNAEAAPSATTWTSLDWLQGSGAGLSTEYNSETGFYHVMGHGSYGCRMYTSYKVKLDGLKITIEEGDNLLSGDMAGFGFSATVGSVSYPIQDANSIAISLWKGLYSGQSRVVVGRNHDYNGEVCVYKDESCTDKDKPFGPASSYVLSDAQRGGVTLEFHLLENKTTYSLKVSLELGAIAAGQPAEKTVYFPASQLNLDEEGKAYIVSHGFPSGSHPVTDVYIKVDEDPGYKTTQTAAETARTEYEAAIEALKTNGTYEQSVEKRDAYLEKIAALRADDKKAEELKLAEIDKKYTEDAEVQAKVKAAVDVSFTAATAAVETLKGETEATAVTQENITAASTAIEAARTSYATMESCLTAANQTEFEGKLADYDFELAHAKAKLWVMGLEAKNAAVEAEKDPNVAATLIGAAEAYNDGYANSDAKTFIDTVTGHDTEKTAMQTRVTNAQNKLTELKTANGPAIKEFYLEPLETAVEKDLTILSNITDAKGKLAELNDKVEIAEGDGELYTRFNTAYATLKAAAEAYVNGQIEEVNTALDKAYEEYTEYDAVRKNFNKINLTLLLEENATIQAAYDALKAKKEAQLLDAFNVTAQSKNVVLEQNYTGIYYENDGLHPSRLNYNKPLDLTAGVTLNIELTQIWCTDCGSENENRSNNFVFNFLGGPNEYKGNNEDNTPANSGGFTLYIWMFDGNCNVQILNPATDVALSVQSQLSTPAEGSVLTIEIKYADYIELDGTNMGKMWQILVNDEAELDFTEAQLAAAGMTSLLDGEGKATGYFSVGTYANDQVKAKYPDGVNAFTIISIGDEEFAKPAPEVATATVAASKTEATVGETVTFTSSFTPGEAVPSSYEWYVNEQKQTVTNKNFAFKGETAGTYTVYCKIDGVKSNEVTVTFAASTSGDPGTTDPGTSDPGTTDPGTTDPETPAENEGGCGSAIGFGGALMVVVVAAAGVVLFARKRKQD